MIFVITGASDENVNVGKSCCVLKTCIEIK